MTTEAAATELATCEEYVALQESAFSVFFVSIADCLRIWEMDFFILRYRPTPTMPVMIPAGRHAIPTAQNQSRVEKWMIEMPAINRAAPARKYAKRVLSFAKTVRSTASSSLKMRSLQSNLEYSDFFISSFPGHLSMQNPWAHH